MPTTELRPIRIQLADMRSNGPTIRRRGPILLRRRNHNSELIQRRNADIRASPLRRVRIRRLVSLPGQAALQGRALAVLKAMADLALAQTAAAARTDRHTGATDRSNSNLDFVPSRLNFQRALFCFRTRCG